MRTSFPISFASCNNILPDFHGIAVHDCWGSYRKYQDAIHAVCCAHLLRELNGVEENRPEQKCATLFKELLTAMKKVKDKASVCLFIRNLCVPFDNNQTERNLRMIKVKTKVSGCFRSEDGAQEYLTIMSYMELPISMESMLSQQSGKP